MLEKKLKTTLYRVDCPPSETLGELHMGLLATAEAEPINQHVTGCPHCQREIASLGKFLATEPLPFGLGDTASQTSESSVQRLIAKLMDSFTGQLLTPAVRGGSPSDDGFPRIYQAEAVEIAIEVQEDLVNPGQKMIVGLLLAFDPEEPLTAVRLRQNNADLQTADIDEFGNFTIGGLSEDTYELLLTGERLEVQIEALMV